MKPGERAFAALFVLAALAALFGDRLARDAGSPRATRRPAAAVKASAAYCPAPDAEDARAIVQTANLGGAVAKLRRAALGEGKGSDPRASDLAPGTVSTVELGELGIGKAAALVESFDSPTATAALVLARSGGASFEPCTAQPQPSWYFAAGSTARGRDTFLLVLNPFAEEASVSVRLFTRNGRAPLPRLRALTVPALTQSVIYLSDYHPEDETFGIEVTVPRGRLIVSRYMRTARGSSGRAMSLTLGVPAPATGWQFAAGEVPADGEELILVANPADREALVQVVFQTADAQVAPPELEEVPVPGGSQVVVKVSDRLPRGTKHGTSVLSTNGVPVVAERQTAVPGGGLRGAEAVPGIAGKDSRWVVPVSSVVGGGQQLSLVNTGRTDATVSVRLLTAGGEVRPPELASVGVGAGRQTTLDLGPFLGDGPGAALVDASTLDVAVEGRLFLGGPYDDFADAPGRPQRRPDG